jgi:Phage terminase large subunit gpA, ATPase domain
MNPALEFCQACVRLQGRPIRFDRRPYLPAIYASQARNVVIRASRQVEKSTFLANIIAHNLVTRPGVSILLVCPRQEQASVFIRSRLQPIIVNSPLVRRVLVGPTGARLPINHMRFINGAEVFVRAAYHSGDAVRGISADILLVDEIQDIAVGDLPVLQETLSHSNLRRTILTGTPKLIENHLEAAFARSTANEWTVACIHCEAHVILDDSAIGTSGIICRQCQQPLNPGTGMWVPRNPASSWGDGFWINHLMVPWVNHDEILERQQTYDPAKFKNEVLGLPTTEGDHIVTRAELDACCTNRPMISKYTDIPPEYRDFAIVGIDWGGGGASRTVIVVGWMRMDFVFEVGAFHRFRPDADTRTILDSVAEVCHRFRIKSIVADGGGSGHHLNRLLLDKLNGPQVMYAVIYSQAGQEPRQDGILWKWTVDRSATIGALFSHVKKRSIQFPCVKDCGTYLDEFACEVCEYDDANRAIRYTHPETMPDDAMHATNYALLLGIRGHHLQVQCDDEA